MESLWTPRQRQLRTIGLASLAILALDIIVLNVLGEVSDDLWLLLVGLGIFVVGAVAIISLLWLAVERSRKPLQK